MGGAGGVKGVSFSLPPSLPSPHFLPSPSPFSPPPVSPVFSLLPFSPLPSHFSLPSAPPPCTPRLIEGQFVDHACTVRPKLYCIKQEQIYVLFHVNVYFKTEGIRSPSIIFCFFFFFSYQIACYTQLSVYAEDSMLLRINELYTLKI